MKKLIYILVLLCCVVIQAQNELRFSTIETDFFIGKPIEHDKKLKNAIQGAATGFFISWNKINPQNSLFNNLYNFPERGYTFLYQNYNSDILGESYGVYRHFKYNLTPSKLFKLKLTTAFGLGYATKSYDPINNNQNFAHGSKLLVTAFLKLQYQKFLENKNINFNTGVSLIHFSNISFKNPNLGLNTLAFNLGLTYKLKAVSIQKNTVLKNHKITQPLKLNIVLRGGYNESLIIGSGLYPFYTVTVYGSKKLNNYSVITSGIDYFHSLFLINYIKNINLEENKNINENNFDRMGVFIGHELTQNNFAFVSQLGYTFYYPYPYVSRIYERFGFKYNLSKHWFSEITMKVNLFRAEGLEIGMGYRF